MRCFGTGDEAYERYHDTEWGRPRTAEQALYEKTCLEGFQAGLAWITVLRKREALREAFLGFDPERVAGVNMAQDVAKVDCLTHAVAAADADKQVGLMGLLAALRDPDVQRGLGFFISVLKNLGTCLAAKK